MLQFLYNLIIEPLVMMYDVLFVLLFDLIDNAVFSIIALSIVINLIVLPLYRRADIIQHTEQDKQKKMRPWLDHIRMHFSGDERFMMQSAYYKVENYNPFNVIREAGPLALQIPFFIAAYRYISSISFLETTTFGPINNLLAPDNLIQFGTVTINVLPVVMTLINIASGCIYSKGQPIRLKIQVYGTAFLFLVLLYNSPSALVIYWTMNNIFSLVKNIYFRHTDKLHRIIPLAASLLMIVLISIGTISGRIDTPRDVFISECIMIISIVTIIREILHEYHVKTPAFFQRLLSCVDRCDSRNIVSTVLMVEFCFVILLGAYIPSSVLASSVTEFVDRTTGEFQYDLLLYPLNVYLGLFMVWMTVLIFSRDRRKRNGLSALLWLCLIASMLNQFLFDPHTGILYSDLRFEGSLSYSYKQICLNILVCLISFVVSLYVFINKPKWMIRTSTVLAISLTFLGVMNVHTIQKAEQQPGFMDAALLEGREDLLQLSRTGKNVVVFMLDRSIGGYVPYVFDELPELKQTYEGFVYYANTISHGTSTNFGSPGLFGGYEYTPAEMNRRSEELLKDKHNEALKVMPKLFSENGYDVVVTDPPYAGYNYSLDLSIYDDIENCHAYELIGNYTTRFNLKWDNDIASRQRNNFLIYGIFRTVPLFMKNYVYDGGKYLSLFGENMLTGSFIDCYSALEILPEITGIVDDNKGCFLLMQNALPHQPTALNPPEYLFDGNPVDESPSYHNRSVNGETMVIDEKWEWEHYCVNVASYQLIGQWLEKLKEYGVYDNTRIILVGDHGRNLGQFENMIHPDGLDVECVWPTLMVKDFNSREPFSTSMEFMTNADVPTLATTGVIDNPVNPYTGNAINMDMKQSPQLVTGSMHWRLQFEDTTFDTRDGHWWTVHDSIFDMNNWTKLED